MKISRIFFFVILGALIAAIVVVALVKFVFLPSISPSQDPSTAILLLEIAVVLAVLGAFLLAEIKEFFFDILKFVVRAERGEGEHAEATNHSISWLAVIMTFASSAATYICAILALKFLKNGPF